MGNTRKQQTKDGRGYMTMKYVKNVCDKGIILSPDKEGEEMYVWDAGGFLRKVLL